MGAVNRILVVHNYYKQRGGEDEVFERDVALLNEYGHEVITYIRDNDEIDEYSRAQKLALPLNTVWSRRSTIELADLMRDHRPDIVHFHNIFPLISPSIYSVCKKLNIPTVQSIHNPRLLCPAATLYRNGQLCLDCPESRFPWPGIVHACYRSSRTQSAVAAATTTFHHWIKTWQRDIDLYMVATDFYRKLFVGYGFPEEKFAVKPHFVTPDPGYRQQLPGDYGVYIGRLEPAKGIWTLLAAWAGLPEYPLIIRGDGPAVKDVLEFIDRRGLKNIRLVERLDPRGLNDLIKGARMLVWPSDGYYETFGLVQTEAFACGVPVIASKIGVGTEIVRDGWNGLHSRAGDAGDLREKIRWMFANPTGAVELGKNARSDYLTKYTPERIYRLLLEHYSRIVER